MALASLGKRFFIFFLRSALTSHALSKTHQGVRQGLDAAGLLGEGYGPLLAKHGVFRLLGPLASDEELCEEALSAAMSLLETTPLPGFKTVAGKQLLSPVYSVLRSPLSPVGSRAAAAETLNLLLAGCEANCALLGQSVSLGDLVRILESCTDYAVQSVVFEALFRFAISASSRELHAAFGGHPSNCAQLLRDAGSASSFASATRAFLAVFNAGLGPHRRVYSLRTEDGRWADFGAAELAVCRIDDDEENHSEPKLELADSAENSGELLISYREVSGVRVHEASLLLLWANDGRLALSFPSALGLLLRDRIAPRIRALVANSLSGGLKSSLVTLPVPSVRLPRELSF